MIKLTSEYPKLEFKKPELKISRILVTNQQIKIPSKNQINKILRTKNRLSKNLINIKK